MNCLITSIHNLGPEDGSLVSYVYGQEIWHAFQWDGLLTARGFMEDDFDGRWISSLSHELQFLLAGRYSNVGHEGSRLVEIL